MKRGCNNDGKVTKNRCLLAICAASMRRKLARAIDAFLVFSNANLFLDQPFKFLKSCLINSVHVVTRHNVSLAEPVGFRVGEQQLQRGFPPVLRTDSI